MSHAKSLAVAVRAGNLAAAAYIAPLAVHIGVASGSSGVLQLAFHGAGEELSGPLANVLEGLARDLRGNRAAGLLAVALRGIPDAVRVNVARRSGDILRATSGRARVAAGGGRCRNAEGICRAVGS